MQFRNSEYGLFFPSSKEVDNMEIIIPGEVSQKKKNKHCILTHVYGV